MFDVFIQIFQTIPYIAFSIVIIGDYTDNQSAFFQRAGSLQVQAKRLLWNFFHSSLAI